MRRGGWVFKKYTSGDKKGQAYHIGYVVDDALNVIEAKGRDHGVVKAPLSEGKWNAYGRPEYYAAEIKAAGGNDPEKNTNGGAAGGWEVARVLKVAKPLMKGDDVKALQAALIANNYHCGVTGIDGIYGKNTAYAVRCFQSAKGWLWTARPDATPSPRWAARGRDNRRAGLMEYREKPPALALWLARGLFVVYGGYCFRKRKIISAP